MEKLKGDEEFRSTFLRNPIQVLADAGITLSPKAADEIYYLIKESGDNIDDFLNCLDDKRAL
jgi:hypothetical protein